MENTGNGTLVPVCIEHVDHMQTLRTSELGVRISEVRWAGSVSDGWLVYPEIN